ncbi:MAG: AAA family ATPase [Magnetococcales bacterium]|nr:AAA family ATPase [Magnetococcales bacterium]
MSHKEIINKVRENLRECNITDPDIRLQPDHFQPNEWRIAVISSQFLNIDNNDREEIALKNLNNIKFQWKDFLTPEEAEWAGPLPSAGDPEHLPLWPEVLAGEPASEWIDTAFPTDADDDLSPPIVVTFYSLRGGVGRSTAMAYTAKLLAAKGRKVICVDMDLEAPGLTSLFAISEEKIRLLEDGKSLRGVIALLEELDAGGKPDFAQHLIPVNKYDSLFLLPAGVPGAEYARQLRLITPDFWYKEEHNPLQEFFEALATRLFFKPDFILLDARTGLSDISGPLLFGLSDMAIITFFPHPQAERGTRLLTRGLLRAKVKRSGRDGNLSPVPRFLVSPVPQSNAPEVKKRYRDRALGWVASWMKAAQQTRQDKGLEEILEEEITHFVEYREDVATSDAILEFDNEKSPYDKLAEWIERLLPQYGEQVAQHQVKAGKQQVLDQLTIAPGTAEHQEDLLKHFIIIDTVTRAMDEKINLVRGRKGTGKTALFRWLTESEDYKLKVIIVHAPQGLSNNPSWMMSYDGFKEVERILAAADAEWRHFWGYYCCIAVQHFLHEHDHSVNVAAPLPSSVSGFLDAFDQTLKRTRFGIRIEEDIKQLNEQLASNSSCILIMDGLDTGFGSTDEDLMRRKRAVEGLFSFFMEISSSLDRLKFKIFLREDVWQTINFQNKSHMFGRTEILRWKDQTDYLKVIIKQIMNHRVFVDFLARSKETKNLANIPDDQWSSDDINNVWNLLVGERMKGGNATFTRNWIWTRLADGNDDHTPRFLLQLFSHAIKWERDEQKKNNYDKSIIRPRSLIDCLSKVSNDAVSSLKEEFQELAPLFSQLSSIGYTPIQKNDLQSQEDLIELAREIGLLHVYETDTMGNAVRYKVPDIYRIALGMTRKGQA